ncbi:MAG: beta-lactamase family protein [Bacteroidales bacterium]|nr:beta-lactamase family protein [Bacteroidales bacterium]
MKSKKKYLILLLFVAIFMSCDKSMNEQVVDCNFNVQTDNATNPKSELYQQLLDEYTVRGLPGISLCIETPEEGLYIGTSGYANIEDGIKMKPCHIHHSASIAKTFISTMILILAQEGKLNLDDPAKNYLPVEIYSNIDNADVATIRQLMNHSSGIYNFDDNYKMYVDTFNDTKGNNSTVELFENYVYGMQAYFEVGTDNHYSNTNFSLLGMIIENVSGISLGDFMQQNIIEPLNLQYTYYKSSPNYPNMPSVVNSYFMHFNNQLQNCTADQKHFSNIAYGHEGVLSNPYDFAFFMKQLVSGNIIDDEYLSQMLNFTTNSEGDDYGLGIFKYKTDFETGFGHTGGALGTMTYAIYFPDSDISFSMCCNLGPVFVCNLNKLFYDNLFNELINVIFSEQQ